MFFNTHSERWNDMIAFSPKDIAIMLNMPTSTITKLCREGSLKTFKVGRHYRVSKVSLFRFIEESEDESIIL